MWAASGLLTGSSYLREGKVNPLVCPCHFWTSFNLSIYVIFYTSIQPWFITFMSLFSFCPHHTCPLHTWNLVALWPLLIHLYSIMLLSVVSRIYNDCSYCILEMHVLVEINIIHCVCCLLFSCAPKHQDIWALLLKKFNSSQQAARYRHNNACIEYHHATCPCMQTAD